MRRYLKPLLFTLTAFFLVASPALAKNKAINSKIPEPIVSARSAVIVDSGNGGILYSKNPHLKLPPASTTKVMTALLAFERLPLGRQIRISRKAYNISPSKAGLSMNAAYRAGDLIAATLISSSNDAAVALAEAISGSEEDFSILMNERAKRLGMQETNFVNATGLTDKKKKNKQYSTAYDLAKLMSYASKDKRIDYLMGILETKIKGSDGQEITLRSHNKMLWKMPKFVKGKTGWTYAAKHTFVGTNYEPRKQIFFAMLASQAPWTDIERLVDFGIHTKQSKQSSFWNFLLH